MTIPLHTTNSCGTLAKIATKTTKANGRKFANFVYLAETAAKAANSATAKRHISQISPLRWRKASSEFRVQSEAKDRTTFGKKVNMIPDLRYCFPRDTLNSLKTLNMEIESLFPIFPCASTIGRMAAVWDEV
jgi:hypothetical protein